MTWVGYRLFPRRPRAGLVAAAITGLLALPASARHAPMPALTGHNGYASAAEINVLGTPSS
jgi:hypothetical protein